MAAYETLKKARETWPDIVDRQFLARYVGEGLITTEELEEILASKGGQN